MTVEEKMDLVVESLQGMERKLEHWKGHSAELPSKARRKHQGPFPASEKSTCSVARTDILVSSQQLDGPSH
jgi:hypothetical protein